MLAPDQYSTGIDVGHETVSKCWLVIINTALEKMLAMGKGYGREEGECTFQLRPKIALNI